MKLPWIDNTAGKPDAMLTMGLMGFVVVLLKVLLGGMTVALAGKSLTLGTIDAGTIGAVLTPTLGAYVARRYTDRKHPEQTVSK
jgi:hypothetical protein